ncbi:MAG: rod shape-determining protein [Pirellulaceae bacterium]|nr:rod shape-determining protein [Planctomycetales bacterium]
MSEQTTYIGMDLGTLKTSVVSSCGRRHVMDSAVGRPKDVIAQAMLRADVVWGDKIREHRRALEVIRPFAKATLKFVAADTAGLDDRSLENCQWAAEQLVRHAIESTNPPQDSLVWGVVGIPSRAGQISKQFIMDVVGRHLDKVLVIHEPFAVAYGMGALDQTLVIDIGAGTIDICPMYGTYTAEEDQQTILMGGDYIDDQIIAATRERFPSVEMSDFQARRIKERYGSLLESRIPAHVELIVDGGPQQIDLTDIVANACGSIVSPIVEGIMEVTNRFEAQLRRRLLENIVLAGGGSQLVGLEQAIEQGVSERSSGERNACSVTRVADCVFAGAAGALKLAMDMPREQWDRIPWGKSQRQAA